MGRRAPRGLETSMVHVLTLVPEGESAPRAPKVDTMGRRTSRTLGLLADAAAGLNRVGCRGEVVGVRAGASVVPALTFVPRPGTQGGGP
eukprot:2670649-Heterocapsa_arctica.AAC.1